MSPVVITLAGGLGNQLFQFALGRALEQAGARVLFDTSWFEQRHGAHTHRALQLEAMGLHVPVADTGTLLLADQRGSRLRVGVHAIHPRLAPPRPWMERRFAFDPDVLRLRGSVRLVGYWQSERYFERVSPALRADLGKPPGLAPEEQDLALRIQAGPSVSVHVRRGDYLQGSAASTYAALGAGRYYERAMEQLTASVPDASYFVFSDDPAWVEAAFKPGMPFTTVPMHAPQVDLWLMAQCTHHVIANSSFSWWGAWLGEGRGRRVIAPRRWFRDPAIDTSDLLPDRWTRL